VNIVGLGRFLLNIRTNFIARQKRLFDQMEDIELKDAIQALQDQASFVFDDRMKSCGIL
jgi:hypothetical protein